MKKCLPILAFSIIAANTSFAQATFKAGWNTYNTRMVIHEYCYNFAQKDSIRLSLTDSITTLVSSDSLVTVTTNYSTRDRSVLKKINYLNIKKQIIRSEEYKDDNLQEVNEWKYDEKNRKSTHISENKTNGNIYKKLYDYAPDKKTGDIVITESAYFNGKIEFYTKSYYDRNSVKYKEVRLNDNNKDVIHIETYTYGDNGKVKERSVYFPEFKVTKKFNEPDGNLLPKCFKTMPVGIGDKAVPAARMAYIKKVIQKNQAVINDAGCEDYEYKFSNFTNCEINVATTKVNNNKRLTYCFKEKML